MSEGDPFGPVTPEAPGGPPFAVAGPTTVVLDGARSGSGSFTVSNVTGRPVRARVLVLPGAGADASWFQVVGESERALPVAGTATVDVTVKVAEKAPAGSSSFVVGAALEEAPDQVVSGPTVVFEVPKPPPPRFRWWILIVAAVALLLLVGGGILIWNITRPEPEPTATDTGRPVLITDSFVFDQPTQQADLDADGIPDVSIFDADLAAVPLNRPTTVSGLMRGVAFTTDPTFESCRDVELSPSVDIPEAQGTTWVCTFTSTDHIAMLEFSTQIDEGQTRNVTVTVWE